MIALSGHLRNRELRPRRLVEKRLPRLRLLPRLVEIAILQMLADASKIFAKECRVRQLECALARRPQIKIPGGGEHRQHRGLEIMHAVRPLRRRGPQPDAFRKTAKLPAEASQLGGSLLARFSVKPFQ